LLERLRGGLGERWRRSHGGQTGTKASYNLPAREKVHIVRYKAIAHATLLPFPALLGRPIMFPSLHGGDQPIIHLQMAQLATLMMAITGMFDLGLETVSRRSRNLVKTSLSLADSDSLRRTARQSCGVLTRVLPCFFG
jgi:hypothetical protein